MSKAVLISIRPEWCEKIINGQKTIEVRKTRPKMDTPFKCYIYKCGNGKVIGEFLCDQIININGAGRIPSDAARPTCLEPAELHQYLGAATGFGWHISDLRVYDHPRDLWEFTGLRETKFGLAPEPITRQPPRPNLNVDTDTDRFLHAAIGGKEIDWKQSRDSTLNVMINGPTSNGFGKDIFRKMARDLYGRLKAYEDIAELCGGFDRLRELAEADKDGRVIILPCKVYETDGVRVYEHTVREVIYETAGGPAFDKNAIGKSIFLTRAEAERAMQEMEGKKDGV